MKPAPARPRRSTVASAVCASAALALLAAQCSAPGDAPAAGGHESDRADSPPSSLEGWATVYAVLQHPRCVNCHPAGDAPLQGDDSRPHAQNVRRGPGGAGLYAMRCSACHLDENVPGPHMPPGAPHWKLPHPDMPLVFEGMSSGELCRQLSDPARNGHRTPEAVLRHLTEDPLVLWGWNPGEGRAPIPFPHDDLVLAARAWIDGGCACPEP
jgi:hypothetical protein